MEEKKNEKNSLDEQGVIFLSGPINQATADHICQKIIEFSISGKKEYIQLIVNSPGGELSAGFAIIDIMAWSSVPIYTTGIGMVASMGLLIFMSGQKGRRVITNNTSLLSHRFWSLQIGNHSQLLAQRKQQDIEHQRILNHYLKHTNIKSIPELESSILRDVDTWLTPEEAVQYGIADIIEK